MAVTVKTVATSDQWHLARSPVPFLPAASADPRGGTIRPNRPFSNSLSLRLRDAKKNSNSTYQWNNIIAIILYIYRTDRYSTLYKLSTIERSCRYELN